MGEPGDIKWKNQRVSVVRTSVRDNLVRAEVGEEVGSHAVI